MNRRHFFLSLAAPIAQRALTAADPIVIVGAGLAGLRAAAKLRDAGARVVVLEGRAGPGGRVRTMRAPFDPGLFAELGPIRISSAHQRVLQAVRDHRLSLRPFASGVGSALVHVAGLIAKSPAELSKIIEPLKLAASEAGQTAGALVQRFGADAVKAVSGPAEGGEIPAAWRAYDTATWPEWLRSRGASSGAVTLMTLGGDSRSLSALYVLRQIAMLGGSDQFFKIDGGMDALPLAMATRLAGLVRYNARVVRIDRSVAGLAVQYREQNRTVSVHATRVILTVPFSTMAGIAIQPPLAAAKARAIAELPYFPAARFLLQMRTRFWEGQGLSGTARTDDPAELWDATYDLPEDAGILGVTAGGAIGDQLAPMTEAEALKTGTDLAARTFPGVTRAFQRGAVMRWSNDPWARGAFAVFRPGQMTTLAPVLARPDDRIHFAGEHTSAWNGWMEGALESGERAAAEVLDPVRMSAR